MQADKRRLSLLTRQARIKGIDRKLAVRKLSDAVAEHARMQNVAQRSRDMASNRASRLKAGHAGELRDLIRFSGTMNALSADADRAGADAQAQAQNIRENISRIDNTLEQVADAARTTERKLNHKQAARNQATLPPLARNLLRRRSGRTPVSGEEN